ncbi:hypothetical protein BRADI_4g33722v3 [Brachypodium distachyon]|uniref:Uncharacterized protein n=1 Tax=Brachypodium distachyon TaxID=15368 RepID=A0A2K2CS48_BRADI|nr:hypothetical protein BRADI_4g33722v3 [Brachypodium distachyon]
MVQLKNFSWTRRKVPRKRSCTAMVHGSWHGAVSNDLRLLAEPLRPLFVSWSAATLGSSHACSFLLGFS